MGNVPLATTHRKLSSECDPSLSAPSHTVAVWRQRYRSAGVDGLRTKPRAGRPRRIRAARQRTVISATLRRPKAASHRSARRLAAEVGLSAATVHCIWQKYGLQLHRVETFKFGRDPEFDFKLADMTGLYLDLPERALVLCVDEKSQIQALNRTQPALPRWPGLPARMSHHHTRHGTTSLFAALEVASGKVHGRCYRRHRHAEFIAFLESLARRYRHLELHLICDNYGTYKHPAVKRWLAAHPRFHPHFTPTSASWLNHRRGSFNSTRRLEQAIMRWLAHRNQNGKPFRWTSSAAHIQHSLAYVTSFYEISH